MTIFTTKNLVAAKILAFFTAVMMIMSMLPVQVWAQEAPAAEETPAEDTTEEASETESDTEDDATTSDEEVTDESVEGELMSASAARLVDPTAMWSNPSTWPQITDYCSDLDEQIASLDEQIEEASFGGKIALGAVRAILSGLYSSFCSDLSVESEQDENISTVIVRPSALNGWVRTGTDGGQTAFFADVNAVLGNGTLKLTSNTSNDARANVSKATNVLLKDLKGLSYKTKQNAANVTAGDAAYRISFDADGDISTTGDIATLIHEPYWQNAGSPDDAPVVNGVWQTWNVDNGIFWASIPSANRPGFAPNLINGAGGPPFYSLASVTALYPNAKVTAFSIGIGSYNPSYDIDVDEVVFGTETPELLTRTTYDFQPDPVVPPPACDLGAETVAATTFDTFNLGNVNAQNSWNATGPFDQAVVTNTYGYTTFGCKSLRISNAVTQSSFGNQTFAAPFADRVGEIDSTDGAFVGGTKFNRYEAQFDIASTKPLEQQSGLAISVSPDRGDGSRMSHLSFVDSTSTIAVNFTEVQGVDDASINFAATHIASLTRTQPHTIKIVVDTNDGADNDVVMIYIDGSLVHTGKSWENYYRFDNESVAEQSPRVIKTLLFRTAGTAAPANNGNGFLFDNMSLKAMNQPEEPVDSVKVHILKYLKTGQVTAQIPNDATAPNFPMTSSWSATNIGSGSGSYVLGNNEGGTTLRYAADTSFMDAPADYTTAEVTGGDSVVLAADTQCVPGKYRLVGYKQGDTLEAAESAATSLTAPAFEDITTDKYVIVVNEKCAQPVTCAIGQNLIQNGSFETETVTANGGTWEIFSTVAGWFASLSSGLEIWNNFNGSGSGLASDGEQNAELDGDDATRITQPVTLVPGATYTLSFDYSPRAGTGLAESKMDAMIDGSTVMTLNADGSANTANVWSAQSYTFVAASTSAVVGFEDKGIANDGGGYGPLLDNVALCMVEEPQPLPTCTLTISSDDLDYVVEKNAAAEVIVTPYHPSWITAIGTSTAQWVWGDALVANPTAAETQTFKKGFNWTGGAVTSATLRLASDNTHDITLGSFTDGDSNEDNYSGFKTYNVSSGIVAGANMLTVEVENWASANGTTETNPAGLMYELTITGTGESCGTIVPVEPEPMVTLNASKIVCDLEADMPNGQIARPITADTAANWVENHESCKLVSGWEFEWGKAGAGNGGDATIGHAANYNTFGTTNVNGLATVNVPMANLGGRIEVREMLQSGYIPFSDNLGAEIYCHTDAAGTDNWDWVNNPIAGGDYYCVAFNMEVPEATGSVTMCKVDANEEPLTGWTMTLLGDKVDDVIVPANVSAGVNSTATFNAGTSYVAVANGTWTNNTGYNPVNSVDTEYSTEDAWVTQMDGYTGYQDDILELQINNTFDPNSDWGAYNSEHVYAQSFVPAVTGTTNLRIFDGTGTAVDESWYPDNNGSLTVDLYEGYAGITDETGCVTFEDVPFGEYVADEVMQDGWEQISGADDVEISEENSTETITIVNEKIGGGNDDDNAPDTYRVSGTKFKVVEAGEDDEYSEVAGWTIYARNGENAPISTVTNASGTYSFNLTAGDWTIYEVLPQGWAQVMVYQNGSLVETENTIESCGFRVGMEAARVIETGNDCDFYNQQTVTEEEPRRSGGGGSGTRVTNRATPAGLVLGAASSTAMCGMYLQDYMRMGNAASSTQVIKLQIFLNAVGIKLEITGAFDSATDAAVRAFQLQYKPEVLTPWYTAGIVPHNNPTGWVYQLTRWKINNIVCPGSEAYPVLS